MKGSLCELLCLLLACCGVLSTILAEGSKEHNATTVEEFLKNQIEVIDNATSEAILHDVVRINSTPTRIFCNHTNTEKIKIYKKAEGFLYILSSNELIAVDLNEKHEAHMHFIGRFVEFEEPVLEIQIEQWQNMIVIILKMSKSLHVYLTKNDFSTVMDLDPIQKIDINSPSDRYMLFKNRKDLFMVTYGIKSEAANELTFYKWKTSFFSQESQETVDLPTKSNLFIFNENVNEPLILSIGYEQNTTHVIILKLNPTTKRWTKLQSLLFVQDYIEHYVVDGQLYLIGCSTESFCAIYKWTNSQFRRHIKINNKVFEKIRNVQYQHDIIITENFHKELSFHVTDNIVNAGSSSVWKPSTDVVDYSIYQAPKSQQLYFVEVGLSKTSLAINFYGIAIIRARQSKERADEKVKDAVECISRLKSYLKNRIPQVQAAHQHAQTLVQHGDSINMANKKSIKTRLLSIADSMFHRMKMPFKLKTTALALQDRTVATNILIEKARRSLRNSERPEGRAEVEPLDNIVVRNLIYNGQSGIFNDLLLASPTIVLSENKPLRDMIANKLVVHTNRINGINLNEILNKTSTKKIDGTRRIKALKANKLETSLLNNTPLKFLESSEDRPLELAEGFEFIGDINVKHLEVKALNGFNVTTLFRHMFLQGERSLITGNLILQNTTNLNDLEIKNLQELPVEKLMTTATDQIISASVAINKFYADTIKSDSINSEKLSKTVALIDGENTIEAPTQFLTLHVLQNLNVLDDDQNERVALTQTVENLKRQVIGTKTSDLSQIYNGQVVIEGSLTLKDVNTFSTNTRIVVDNKEVPQKISSSFWMKSLKQEIKSEKFTIGSSKTKSGHVVTSLLNSHPIQDFFHSNAKSPRGPVHLRFENAIVEGDVRGLRGNIPSLLYSINQTAVLRRGLPVTVHGSIEFREKLSVRKLVTDKVNDSPVKDFVVPYQKIVNFAAPKIIKKAVVSQIIIGDNISIDQFNNIDTKSFLTDAKRIDQPFELESLKVKTFIAANLNTNFFESHEFNEFIRTLENQFQTEAIKPNLRIAGSVEFKSNIFLGTLNDKTVFDEFVNMLVSKESSNTDIGGLKTFQDLTVRSELTSKFINSFVLDRLLHKSLSKDNSKQTITGEFFAKNLRTNAIFAKEVNEMTWDQFVDRTRLHLPLKGNFQVDELNAENLETTTSSFEFVNIMRTIQHPKRTNWATVTANNVESSVQKSTPLGRIISSAVYKTGPLQVITGKTQIDTANLYVKKLFKSDGIVISSLSAVNVHELFSDSVKNQSDKIQVISGITQFLSPMYVDDLKIGANAYFDSTVMNNINLLDFNRTIARPKDVISSEKSFAYLHAEEIELLGKINGVPLDSIVFVINNEVTLPSLSFNSLELINLETFMFFDYSFGHFLENRMRKHGEPIQEVNGFVTIQSLDIHKDSRMSSINSVPIDELVFQQSDQLQDIQGHVIVIGNITLKGPCNFGTINDVDFADFVRNSVLRFHNHIVNVLQLPAVELMRGLVTNHSINGHRIRELLSSDAHIPKVADLLSLTKHVQSQISNINELKRSKSARSKRLLYIDYDPEVEISYNGSGRRCVDEVVEAAKHNSIVVREKRESEMTVELKSVTITVKPNLQCRQNVVSSRDLEIWWINKGDPENNEFMRNFSFPNEVVDVKFLESKGGDVFMILTTLNETSGIGFLKLARSENDWFEAQPTIKGFNRVTRSSIIETPKQQFLVVSSFDETSPKDFISIFKFDPIRNEFLENQRKFSGEKFDIILGVSVLPKSRVLPSKTFLILAQERGRVLYIYRLKDDSQEFVFQRKIPFESEIVEIVVLHITDGPYFIVSLQTGDFCLFEWRGIENWKVKQCGHFTSINRVKTYEYLKRQHLFLASTLNTGTALTVHRQGDLF